jgi:hypothetical protein
MRAAVGLLCALTASCTADAVATLSVPGADPLDASAIAADATARDASTRDGAVRDAAVRDAGARDAIVVDAATEEPPSCADMPLTVGVEPGAVAMDSTPEGHVRIIWADTRGLRFEQLRGMRHYSYGPRLDLEGVLELDRPARDGVHDFLLMRGGGRGIVLDLADASIRRELIGVMHGLFASEGVARWVRRDDDGRRLYLDTTAPSTELISRGLVPSPAELRGALVSLDEEYLLLAARPRVLHRRAGVYRQVPLDGLEPLAIVRMPLSGEVRVIAERTLPDARRQLVLKRVDVDDAEPQPLLGSEQLGPFAVDVLSFGPPYTGEEWLALAWSDVEAGPVHYTVLDGVSAPVLRTVPESSVAVGTRPTLAWEPNTHGLTIAWTGHSPSRLLVRCQLPY